MGVRGQYSPDKVFDGRPCRNGHGTLRYINGRGCVVCAREQCQKTQKSKGYYAEARRQRYAENPDHRRRRQEENRRTRQKPGYNEKRRERYNSSPEHAAVLAKRAAYNKTEAARLRTRKYFLKKNYGLTPQCIDRMMIEQGGACKICKRTDQKLVVDHCHSTGKVRGLLCKPCNIGIGALYESEEIFMAAVLYLRGAK